MADHEYEVDVVSDHGFTDLGLDKEPVPAKEGTPEQNAEDQARQEQSDQDAAGSGEGNPKNRRKLLRSRVDELTRKNHAEARKRQQAEHDLEQRTQQYADSEKTFQTTQRKSAGIVYNTLGSNKRLLEASLKVARERGDTDTETKITDQIIATGTQIAELKTHYPDIDQNASQPQPQSQGLHPQQADTQKPEPAAQQPTPTKAADVPEAGQDWVMANDFIREHKELHGIVSHHDSVLQMQGEDPTTKEYYAKLTARLKNDFPKELAAKLQLTMNADLGDDEDDGDTSEDDTDQVEAKPEKAPSSAGAGIGDSGRSAPAAPKGKQKVTLTREQVAYCDRNGVDRAEYARQVHLSDNSRNSTGYAQIL